MFSNTKAFSSFAVKDTARAKTFYAETLGLKVDVMEEMGNMLVFKINGLDNDIIVYPKPDHTPATFTVLNFPVDNIEEAVDALTAKGIRFEQYEGDIKTDEKGIARGNGGPDVAWFKDPDGNILSVLQDKS